MDNILSSPQALKTTDWKLCILCQKNDSDLRDPYKSTRKDSVRIDENGKSRMKGYETLATNLISLDELNALLFDINISRLNDGTGV